MYSRSKGGGGGLGWPLAPIEIRGVGVGRGGIVGRGMGVGCGVRFGVGVGGGRNANGLPPDSTDRSSNRPIESVCRGRRFRASYSSSPDRDLPPPIPPPPSNRITATTPTTASTASRTAIRTRSFPSLDLARSAIGVLRSLLDAAGETSKLTCIGLSDEGCNIDRNPQLPAHGILVA